MLIKLENVLPMTGLVGIKASSKEILNNLNYKKRTAAHQKSFSVLEEILGFSVP